MNTIEFSIPETGGQTLASLFSTMESERGNLYIEEYSVFQTTLDQVSEKGFFSFFLHIIFFVFFYLCKSILQRRAARYFGRLRFKSRKARCFYLESFSKSFSCDSYAVSSLVGAVLDYYECYGVYNTCRCF